MFLERPLLLRPFSLNSIIKLHVSILFYSILSSASSSPVLFLKHIANNPSFRLPQETFSRGVSQLNESIVAKEAQVNQLKKRNQELEKFRVVFGFKLQKLAKELEPKEREILKLEQQKHDQQEELMKSMEEMRAVKKALKQKKSILGSLNKQMKETQQRVTERDKYILQFRAELNNMMDVLDDGFLRDRVKRMWGLVSLCVSPICCRRYDFPLSPRLSPCFILQPRVHQIFHSFLASSFLFCLCSFAGTTSLCCRATPREPLRLMT